MVSRPTWQGIMDEFQEKYATSVNRNAVIIINAIMFTKTALNKEIDFI